MGWDIRWKNKELHKLKLAEEEIQEALKKGKDDGELVD